MDGVIHYAVANMPGGVPRTSTLALTNATFPYALTLANKGWKKACQEDHALALGHWLLGPGFPPDVTVILVEAASFEPGADLTPLVAAALERVVELVLRECATVGADR